MNGVSKKIVKNIAVILIIITILLGSVYNLMNWTVTEFRASLSERKNAIYNNGGTRINDTKIEDINGGDLTDNTEKVNVSGYGDIINKDYKKPDINADDIIREAVSYSKTIYNAGSKKYSDATSKVLSASSKTQDKKFLGYSDYSLDCAGLVYATLRHLGVRLVNFSDIINYENVGRLGPIPLNTWSWIWEDKSIYNETTGKGNVKKEDIKYTDINTGEQKVLTNLGKYIIKPYVYNLKWENGDDLTKIVPYQEIGTGDGEVKNYGDFIEKNNIAKGSVIVTSNPTQDENHMWFYIGKYKNVDEVKNYIKSLGITVINEEDINYYYVEDGSEYWSIECTNTEFIAGKNVYVTNRDPAISKSELENISDDATKNKAIEKCGNGYAAFTLTNEKEITGDYSLSIGKKSINDTETLIGNAEFKVEQYKNSSSTTDVTSYGYYNLKNRHTDNESLNRAVTLDSTTVPVIFGISPKVKIDDINNVDTYKITETRAPNGYSISTINGKNYVYVQAFKRKNNDKYEVYKLRIYSDDGWDYNLESGEDTIYINSKGQKVSKTDSYVIELSFDNMSEDIIFIWRDQKNDNYNLRIYKQSMNDTGWSVKKGLAGFGFKIVQKIDNNENSITVKTEEEQDTYVKLNKDSYNDGDGNVLLSNETARGKIHTYEITETNDIPSGYDKAEFFRQGNTLILEVVTDENTLAIKQVNVKRKDKNGNISNYWNTPIVAGNVKKEDWITITVSNKFGIIIGIKNPKITGKYPINILKVSKENFNSNNSVKNNIEDNVSNSLDDARFNVISSNSGEYSDVSSKAEVCKRIYNEKKAYSYSVSTQSGKKVSLLNDYEEQVIDNINTYDVYTVEERLAPQGYKVDNNVYALVVNKTIKENTDGSNRYAVDSIQIFISKDGGESFEEINIPEGVNKDGSKYIVSESNDYGVRFDYTDNNIIFTLLNDKVSTDYKLQVKKVDESGNPLQGVAFKVLMPSGNEITTEKTDKNGLTTIDEGKIDYNTIISSDKAFGFYKINEVVSDDSSLIKLNEELTVVRYNSYNRLNSTIDVGFTLQGSDNNKREVTLSDGTKANVKIDFDDDTNITTLTIPNKTKSGSYNFKLTKTDVSGKEIANENTKFSVKVYESLSVTVANKVTYGKEVNLKNTSGKIIDSSNLTAETGVTTGLDGIKIEDADIGKTYYFVVNEDKAPDKHTKIDYTIVIPVEFSISGDKYIATKKDAFAVTSDNLKKELSDMSTNTNECVSTEQIDTTINVKVPNKENIKGVYSLRIKKVNASENDKPVGGVKFKVKSNKIDGGEKTTLPTHSSSGEVTVVLNVKITKDNVNIPDEYTISEVSLGNNKLLKLAEEVKIKVNKFYDESDKSYKVKNVVFDNGKTEKEVKLENGKTAIAKVSGGVDESIVITIPNENIEGSYDFKVTKTDISGKVIESEKTVFSVNVYGNMTTTNNKVTFSNKITLKKTDGTTIDSSNLTAKTGVTTGLDGIKIDDSAIKNKTYYFVVEEVQAPDEHTKIDYKVVVPVKFALSGSKYIATKQTAYAITSDGTKKILSSMGTSTNECVSTEQTDVTINVKVPNKEIVKNGRYNIDLLKKNEDLSKPISGVEFNISCDTVAQANRNVSTDTNGKISITNGTVEIIAQDANITKNNQTKVNNDDVYVINEISAPTYLKLKNNISLTVKKGIADNQYKVTKIVAREISTSNSVSLAVGQQKEVTLKNVKLADNSTSVDIKINIDDKQNISITVPNKSITGKYNLKIKKYDQTTKKALEGVAFKINDANQTKTTNAEGVIDVTGNVDINNQNVNNDDTYKIEELENASVQNHVILAKPITVIVKKGEDSTGGSYIPKQITIKYTNAKGETVTNIGVNPITHTANKTTFNVLAKDGSVVSAMIEMSSDGTITLTVNNPEKTGEYSLQLYKTCINTNNEEKPFEGAWFYIQNSKSAIKLSRLTGENGYTKVISNTITKNNYKDEDVYTITEGQDLNDKIVKLKNGLTLKVTKKISSDNTKYVLDTITLSENNTNNTTGKITINETSGANGTLNNVLLQDNRKVNVSIGISNANKIVISIQNREIIGEYTLKIKKVNSVTGETIDGVTFNVMKNKQTPYNVVTANGGIAIAGSGSNINNSASDVYEIKEEKLPDNLKNYLQITDFKFGVTITPTLNANKTAYVVTKDDVHITPIQVNGSQTLDAQRAIVEETVKNFEVANNVITLTIYNEPTTDYKLKINKVDLDSNETITSAKFTIYENDVQILNNATLSTLGDYIVNKNNVTINKTYTYKIYENEAAPGYDNILKNAYIELEVVVDESGNVSASYRIRGNLDTITSKELLELKKKFNDYSKNTGKQIVEVGADNTVTFNIPNPKSTTPLSLYLNKHQLNSENGVTGARFSVRRLYVKKETNVNISDITNKFNTGTGVESLAGIITSTTNTKMLLDSLENVETGDSYYYEIKEDSVPKNFISTYKKIILRAHINDNKTVTSTIITICTDDTTNWVQYNAETHGKIISESVSGNNIVVKWANSVKYTVKLFKKQYKNSIPRLSNGEVDWNNMDGLEGATFTITQKTPTEKNVINNEIIYGSYEFENVEANTETKYEYEITEVATKEGFINMFEGLKINLYVTTSSDGSIITDKTSTYYTISGYKSQAQKKYVEDLVKLEATSNLVTIYIANKEIENNFDISLMKIADTQLNGNLVGVKDVEFEVFKPDSTGTTNWTSTSGVVMKTDKDGYLHITDLPIHNTIQTFRFREKSVPDGVTKIADTWIVLEVDTRGLTKASEITKDKIKVSVEPYTSNGVNAIAGLTVDLEGTTILLTVPNPIKNYVFQLLKTDELSTPINQTDGITAPIFSVYKYNDSTNNWDEEKFGPLSTGIFVDAEFAKPNTTYKYKIEEHNSKAGFINVLEGYELYAYIKTNSNCEIGASESEGTYYELVAKTGKTPKYTKEEILNNGYINFKVNKTYNDDNSLKSQTVYLQVKNPYEYRVRLEKKDSAGVNSVNKATITAKRIDKNSDGTTYTLNKVATYKTEKQLIKNNVGLEPNENTAQTWEIKETGVEAPYINILGNNKVQVQVIWRDSALNIVEHQAKVGNAVVTRKFKVLDESGNDVTEDYSKYVDVSTEKVLGEWQLVVTIKDPLKYYVDINKVESNDDKTPISGANLKITDGKNEVEIKDGKSSSGTLKSEIGIGESISYTITESSTIAGHTNVLKDKKIIYAIRMYEDETIKPVFSTVLDTSVTPAKELKGEEKNEVLKYIKYDIGTTDDGYKILHFYIENPYEYKFKLNKKDTSGNLLDGTQIEVTSSNSGKHYLNSASSMEFSETGLNIGDTVTYNIREIRTVSDSAYVNVFENRIIIVVRVQEDGTLKTVMSFMLKPTSSGTFEQVPLSKVDFLQVNITNPDNNGIQTVELALENPVKIDIDIVKKQVGSNGAVIPNTEFTVVSSFSGEHHDNTASNGKLSFREDSISAGEYTYKVTENNTASSKYINILKDKYMLVTIKVSADGSITEKSYKLFNSNGTEITDAKVLEDLNKYISLNVDSTGQIDKLIVTILNPVTLDFNLYKQTTAGNKISGAKFKIISEISGEVSKITDNDNGKINVNENYVTPGVYKYEVIEESTAGEQYNNILSGCKLVIYVKVDGNGDLSIVKDKSGTDYTNKNDYKYTIVNSDGSEVNSEKLDMIHKYIKISNTSNTNEKGSVDLIVINSVNYKINIIKKDSSNKDLSGTKFTVIRDGSNAIFENKEVTAETEITESNMSNGNYVYYITENSTVPNSGYINMLSGKFIKVYTEVTEHGELKIKDSNLKDSANYFEIYEGNINNMQNAKLLDKTQNADLYKLINVESVANGGIYTLNVKVENPQRDFKLVLNKKIFGEEGINQANAKFKIISQFSGEHADLTTDKDGNIMLEEKCVPANTYKYAITETQSAGEQFKNLLDNVYILIYVRVNDDGTVDIVDEDGIVANTQYYLYKGQDDTSMINKIEDNTNIDESISVSKNSRTDIEEIDIFVKDPEFYNFELVKKDRDTTKKMNGVTFTYLVYDNNGKKVDLINAETLEEIVENEVTTKNVNGVDGVINIPNILIPKAGIYTYIFHEESTDDIFDCLYKSLASDIRVDVEIVVQNNEYVIKSTTVTQGNKYVEAVSTTTTKAQTASLTVLNERIKGSYNLTINKLDVYTKEKLDGAKFNVTVQKDGSDYELYKVTENVEAKEVIIPGEYTVTQGKLEIPNIRIERPETYTITLTETKAPEGYMLLDEPIVLDITTGISGENDDAKYVLESVELISGRNHSLVDMKNDSESITVNAENEYFDLSLRKSITSISYEDGSKDGQITEDDTKNRIPDVITDKLLANEDTTAIYNHNKQPIRAYASQYVIYTIRVYNEGEIDGYAEEISDHLPEYLEFVDDEFNDSRDWIYDSKTRIAKTTYLSQTKDSEKNLIKAMNKETGELDYKEVQIKCKISSIAPVKSILTNIAEISISKANDRTSETVDRDSTTNNVKVPESSKDMSDYKKDELDKDYVEGQEDDDDFEKLIIEEFDLALRKYIVAVNDEELLKDSDSNNVTDDKNNENTNDSENTEDENNKNTNDSENTEDENNKNTNDSENTEDKNKKNTNDNENTEDKDKDDESTEDGKNTEDKEYAREPIVNVSALKDGSSTTATYTHPKDPVEVSVDDIVTYTIEVFNEGTVSGYASLIKDDIPEGVEFVTYEKGDGSTNDIYRWKMVDENDNEVTDPSKAKYVVSDYLSKANEESEGEHLLKAYDYTSDKLDSKYVKIEFRVICKQDYPKIITNYAQISEDTDESGKDVRDRDSTPNEWKDEDDEDIENIKVTYLDLALRKFITAVNEEVVTNRIPQVDSTALIEETGTTATYTHPKDPVLVHTTDIVTYTLRVYNEGSKNGYATQIKDDIPEGLEFVVDNEINKEYGWKLVDENDNEVTDISKAKYVVTNYLSKDNEKVDGEYMMKAFDKTTMDTPDHREVKIAFRVVEPTTSDRVLINYAQISDQTDGKGKRRDDRDSTPNEWKGEDDEDIEKVKVLYFDLALRKWVTQAIVTENGKTTVHETGHHAEDDPEEVVKVDLKKRKINSVEIKFRYSIRITNEGEIAGAATEISDYIPSGLKFVQEDNPDWREKDGKVVTNQLAGVILQPGESAEVEILLTWINGKENMGVMINTAEISEDYNKYDTPDIDSTPNNKVPGEDDIDDAPVMLAVKTGSELIGYVALLFGFIVIIGLGVNVIRKKIK